MKYIKHIHYTQVKSNYNLICTHANKDILTVYTIKFIISEQNVGEGKNIL
jgi:hypothetical protein